jgi:hypothetical protein
VVAIKATFELPPDQDEPKLAKEQLELTQADEFEGEPGFSAPLYETDYAHRKPFCDVLVNGSAYAPRGKKERRVEVGIKIGSIAKSFVVTGNRVWKKRLWGVSSSEPEPFDVMKISYSNAFGGIDNSHDDPSKFKTFLENPVGVGYSHYKKNIDGQRMPNAEEIGKPITNPYRC